MIQLFKKIVQFLSGRFMLNAYLWIYMLLNIRGNYTHYKIAEHQPPYYWLHVACMHLLYMAMIYMVTLVLIPEFLLKKKRLMFLVLLFAEVSVFALIIGYYSEWLITRYPLANKANYITFGLIDRKFAPGSWDYFSNIFIDVGGVVFLFVLGCLMQYFFKERKRTELLQKKQLESELMLLRSQINPHFLFNVLNSIYSLSLKKSDLTPQIVLKLSDILRYMLYESKADHVSLEKEISMLQDYISIEQVRLVQKDAIHIDVEGPLQSYVIAPALLISFIENAVKHGLDSRAEDAFVKIHITMDPQTDILHFDCLNNYKSLNGKVHTKKAGGIGLENVNKRLSLIYGDKQELSITDNNELYEVNLQIKLKKNELSYSR